MTDGSPRLAVVLRARPATAVLTAVRDLAGVSLGDVLAAVRDRTPAVEIPMFTNAWYDGQAAAVRALLDLCERHDTELALYELPDGSAYDPADPNRHRITADVVRNVIAAGDADRARFERGES